ncbi:MULTISPECIES: GNAT family N-acetyltransferase [Exiguobacterium]|uniref:GNAT family N-acetyltransferase n=1 Tax=Exiguobacterium TaxID=33986 RepID=UPI001AE95B6C|nr:MULTISPECIES: N-acetyltransferase [Exiguobacterium]MCT4781293.1 N-acetyltransferase [Exiguobacterium soli]
MQIRTEKFKDAAAIRIVHQAAFGQAAEANLVEALREDEESFPHYSRVAVTDTGEIVGHVLLSRIYIEDIPSLALAPVGVKPVWQRKGIGSELIRQVIEEAREAGELHIVVLGHDSYYPQFGFERAVDYGIEAPFPVPADFFLIMPLERQALKGIQGIVRYSKPFSTV